MTLFKVQQALSISEYQETVRPFLQQRESANNLMLGLLSKLEVKATPYLLVIRNPHHQIQCAAFQTSPQHNLLLSWCDDEAAVDALADEAFMKSPRIPGILGPKHLARRFVDRWARHAGKSARLEVQERIYALSTVRPGEDRTGTFRWANPPDALWMIPWLLDFVREATPEAPDMTAEQSFSSRVAACRHEAGFMIMEVQGQPRSIAGYSGSTGKGIRVAPVYTPQAERRQGYASTVVRHLSKTLLDLGYQQVFLFTDLDNPTTHHIYQHIGYEPIIDVDQYRLR